MSHFMSEDGLELKHLYNPTKVNAATRKVYEDKALDLTNSILFMRGCKCHPDKKMIKGLESEYAHGNKDAYPLTLYGMLKLYRKEYIPQPKKRNNNPNDNNGNEDNEKDKEDKKNEEEKPEDDAINAHMDAGSDDDDAKAEAFLAAHVDDKDSIQVGWVDESLDD